MMTRKGKFSSFFRLFTAKGDRRHHLADLKSNLEVAISRIIWRIEHGEEGRFFGMMSIHILLLGIGLYEP